MNFPLTITFHNMPRSIQIEEEVQAHAKRLAKVHPRIQQCEVILDLPHHHRNKGNEFQVKIRLGIPGHTMALTSSATRHCDHTDVHKVVRDAFDSARRQVRRCRVKPWEKRQREHQRARTFYGVPATTLGSFV